MVHECHQGRYLGSPQCITTFFFAQQKLLVCRASFNVTLIVAGLPLGFSRVQGSMVAEVRRALSFPLLPLKPSIDLRALVLCP